MCRVGVCCYQWASCVVSEAGLLSLQGKEKNWRRGRARVLLLERHWFDSPGQHLVAQPLPSVYVMYIWITVSRRNGRPLKALKCDAKTLWRAGGGGIQIPVTLCELFCTSNTFHIHVRFWSIVNLHICNMASSINRGWVETHHLGTELHSSTPVLWQLEKKKV